MTLESAPLALAFFWVKTSLPSLAEMVLDHTNDQSCTLEELEEHIEVANRTTMY